MREADLYPPLKRHFEALGWRVYAEVPAPHGGFIDLLAVRDEVSLAVELKTWCSRVAARQARVNRACVWESWVAAPGTARIAPQRRAGLARSGIGLLAVGAEGVETRLEARRQAPPCTVRQAFGRYLSGGMGAVFAAANGGVPNAERVRACEVLAGKVRASLEARGGIANTDQILHDTLSWNYCRSRRGGLLWLLADRFTRLCADVWALPSGERRRALAEYALPLASLVRTHLPGTWVCLPDPGISPLSGDIVRLSAPGRRAQRRHVVSAERHPIVETPQRELRCGPAVFFPWRCPPAPLPAAALVLRLAER